MVIHDYAINPDCYCKSTVTLFDPFVPTGKGILATSLIPHHWFFLIAFSMQKHGPHNHCPKIGCSQWKYIT